MVVINTETLAKGLKALSTVPAPYVKDLTGMLSEITECLHSTEKNLDRLRNELHKIEDEADRQMKDFEEQLGG